MLSKADIKYLNSLQNKKYRKIEHAFLVEGLKNVGELLHSDYEILRLFCSEKVLPLLFEKAQDKGVACEVVPESVLQQLGTLDNNHTALAVASIKESAQGPSAGDSGTVLVLDGINDPGNLGTIVRTADWYGISHIVASHDTVDVYNPKVINASKGSFTRVQVMYEELEVFLDRNTQWPIYAACLEGESIHSAQLVAPAVLLMGNEANGIRPELLKKAHKALRIPRFGKAESLNVGVATGILLDRLLGGK